MTIRTKVDAAILATTACLLGTSLLAIAMPGYSIGEKITGPQLKLADSRRTAPNFVGQQLAQLGTGEPYRLARKGRPGRLLDLRLHQLHSDAAACHEIV
jgi:hypothetical protein